MHRKLIFALAALTCTADLAQAEPPANVLPMPMLGSDTLRELTLDMLKTCGVEQNIDYLGTGSTAGGTAMGSRNQQISPQSRFLNSIECSSIGNSPPLGQGITIGLDGIGVFGDAVEATSCNALRYTGNLVVTDRNGVAGVQCPNCSGNTYTFSDWRDVLRIVYGGQSAHISADPCLDADPSRSPTALGGTTPTGCGNGAIGIAEQCDDGNTANFDGCSSNCTWEIGDANRCNSDLRHELVATFGNLFQGGCSDPECTQLRHAFRRDDSSGTTDTFLSLLGLPAVTTRTFCNGFDIEDLDPIRRTCDDNEQVCGNVLYSYRQANPNGGPAKGPGTVPEAPTQGGDLGLLLPITLPADTDMMYGAACGFGRFDYVSMPFVASSDGQRCPEGNARAFALCLWPTTLDGKFNCLAGKNTRPGVRELARMDGRAYNLVPRNPNTGALLLVRSGISDRRYGGGGFYRLHQTAPLSIGTGTCTEAGATEQIGCLVSASPCSIGYAGREALSDAVPPKNKAFRLRSPLNDANFPAQEIALDDILIRRLIHPSGSFEGTCGTGPNDLFGYRYPLSRRLWISASRGFGLPDFSNISDIVDSDDSDTLPDIPSMEQTFAMCIADRSKTDGAIVRFGFVTLSDRNCSAGVCSEDERAIDFRARSCSPRCGDGIQQTGETCDDGNTADGDSCPADCTIP